jgi:hypothetical protein
MDWEVMGVTGDTVDVRLVLEWSDLVVTQVSGFYAMGASATVVTVGIFDGHLQFVFSTDVSAAPGFVMPFNDPAVRSSLGGYMTAKELILVPEAEVLDWTVTRIDDTTTELLVAGSLVNSQVAAVNLFASLPSGIVSVGYDGVISPPRIMWAASTFGDVAVQYGGTLGAWVDMQRRRLLPATRDY